MLSTRMIIDHLMLSMKASRTVLGASDAASVPTAIGMSVIRKLAEPPRNGVVER